MYENLSFVAFLLLLISINGQYDDDRDFPAGRHSDRHSKASFGAQFQRGRCPHHFYQLGDECVYFSTDGKIYSWKQAEHECSRRIARLLNNHPNLQSVRGVRQLVLNTPEKTKIFRALYRKDHEQNFAVRLPSDYNTLPRCRDGKDDQWPEYCTPTQDTSSTCFETISRGENNDICLRDVACHFGHLRLACEFTLPDGAEITDSKFRNCPPTPAPAAAPPSTKDRSVTMWKWIGIGVGCVVIIVIIIVIGVCIRKGKGYRRARTG